MASQQTKNLDTTSSYVPIDPRAFPENYLVISKEDSPYPSKPIVPYEGYNFMPSSYGYKSYFGTNSKLNINALLSRKDDVFIFQTAYVENLAIALCEDGIWIKDARAVGDWEHAIVLPLPPEGSVLTWTKTIIGEDLYCYRAQGNQYFKMASVTTIKPQGDEFFIDTTGIVLAKLTTGILAAGTYVYYAAAIYTDGSIGSASSPKAITILADESVKLTWNKNELGITGFRIYRSINSGDTEYTDFTLASPLVAAEAVSFVDDGSFTYLPLTGKPEDFGILVQAGEFIGITPTFLNMAAQQGVFKAGGRLGFWDSSNSVSWSNIDDTSDFVPAILTNAGNTKFQEVSGKIVTILPHGEHFIIYATDSIVLVAEDGSSFQWNPALLLKGSGIVFPREVVSGIPSTQHYANTSIGLFSIEKGTPSVIIPEVTDFLKEAKLPTYLSIMEGRYLVLEVMDKDYIDGLVSIKESTIPPSVVLYPTTPLDESILPTVLPAINMSDLCSDLYKTSNGLTKQMQDQGEEARVTTGSPPKKEGTNYKPVWTCYLSKGPVGGAIDWQVSPCSLSPLDGSPVYPMSPSSSILDASIRPPLVANTDAYFDGWTIERFVAIQTTLWEAEDKAREEWLSAVSNRVAPKTSLIGGWGEEYTGPPVKTTIPADTATTCQLGEVVNQFTTPMLSIGPCSFGLTRLGIQKVALSTRTTNRYREEIHSEWEIINYLAFSNFSVPSRVQGSAGQAHAKLLELTREQTVPSPSEGGILLCTYAEEGCSLGTPTETGYSNIAARYIVIKDLDGSRECFDSFCNTRGTNIAQVSKNRTNQERQGFNQIGVPQTTLIADAPYCSITGWKYTGEDGLEHTIEATTCTAPYPVPPEDDPVNVPEGPNTNGTKLPANVINTDGSVCGFSFPSVTIPGLNGGNPIDWATPPSIFPPVSFLLQEGSIAPIYPTMRGALVYDLQLKKWGKYKGDYKLLLDWKPLNTSTYNIIPFETFGVSAGVVKEDGLIYLFDGFPIDSKLRYGKIGYSRQGMTSMEEVRVTFRTESTGLLVTESSLNGSTLEASLTKSAAFTNATEIVMTPSTTARYHTIEFQGLYDIKHIEYRGTNVGNR